MMGHMNDPDREDGGLGIPRENRSNLQELMNYLDNNDSRHSDMIRMFFETAIKTKDTRMIQYLIMNGVSVNLPLTDNDETAIHLAAKQEFFKIIPYLFEASDYTYNYNCTDEFGFSYFHITCIVGLTQRARHFIENGVNVNGSLCRNDYGIIQKKFIPLNLAVQNAQLSIVRLLLDHQANIYALDEEDRTALHYASGIPDAFCNVIQSKMFDNSRPFNVFLEQVIRIKENSLEIVDLLIDRGCNVNAKDRKGNTPLCSIFHDPLLRLCSEMMKSSRVTLKAKRTLVSFLKIKIKVIDKIRACQCEKFKFLLNHGADVTTPFGESEDTILHVAIKDLLTSRNFEQFLGPYFADRSHTEMIEAILNLKIVNVNAPNKNGKTPIDMAMWVLSADIVKVLVNHGADLSSVDIGAFCYSSGPPCLEAVKNLIDIVEIRRSTGFDLSSRETLAILRFLIAQTFTTYCEDNNVSEKFRAFLELGTDDAVIMGLKIIAGEITETRIYTKLMAGYISGQSKAYLMQMRLCGLSMCKEIEDNLKLIISKVSVDAKLNDVFLKRTMIEANRMKTLKLLNSKSLRDILNSPLDQMYSFLKNSEFRQSIGTNFPLTSGIIKGFFAKCLIRRFALQVTNDSLRFITATPLPDACCEWISKYLDNYDLLHLFKTTLPPQPKQSPLPTNEETGYGEYHEGFTDIEFRNIQIAVAQWCDDEDERDNYWNFT